MPRPREALTTLSSGTDRLNVHSWLFTKASVTQEGNTVLDDEWLTCAVKGPERAAFHTQAQCRWRRLPPPGTSTPQKLRFAWVHRAVLIPSLCSVP